MHERFNFCDPRPVYFELVIVSKAVKTSFQMVVGTSETIIEIGFQKRLKLV